MRFSLRLKTPIIEQVRGRMDGGEAGSNCILNYVDFFFKNVHFSLVILGFVFLQGFIHFIPYQKASPEVKVPLLLLLLFIQVQALLI